MQGLLDLDIRIRWGLDGWDTINLASLLACLYAELGWRWEEDDVPSKPFRDIYKTGQGGMALFSPPLL